MNIVLLDTNIVSFLFKGDTRANEYTSLLQDNRLAISFMTVAELFEWAAVHKWGNPRQMQLEHTLSTYVVVPIDIDVCRRWGMIRAERQAIGRTIAPQDAWIAATALVHALPLITHNPRDFSDIAGLEVRSVITT